LTVSSDGQCATEITPTHTRRRNGEDLDAGFRFALNCYVDEAAVVAARTVKPSTGGQRD
jgi:hypothetical protein